MSLENVGGSIALRAFLLIFLAEMGDKTQLMSMTLSAQYRKPVWVFLGAVVALALVTLLGVAFGEAIARVIPPRRMHQIAGMAFIAFGVLMLIKKV